MKPITQEIAKKLKEGTKLIVLNDQTDFEVNEIVTVGGKYYKELRDYDIDSGRYVPIKENDNGYAYRYFALYLDIDMAIKNVYTAINKAKRKKK